MPFVHQREEKPHLNRFDLCVADFVKLLPMTLCMSQRPGLSLWLQEEPLEGVQLQDAISFDVQPWTGKVKGLLQAWCTGQNGGSHRARFCSGKETPRQIANHMGKKRSKKWQCFGNKRYAALVLQRSPSPLLRF